MRRGLERRSVVRAGEHARDDAGAGARAREKIADRVAGDRNGAHVVDLETQDRGEDHVGERAAASGVGG